MLLTEPLPEIRMEVEEFRAVYNLEQDLTNPIKLENVQIDQQISRIEDCLDFLETLKLDSKMLDLVMIHCDPINKKFSPLMFNVKHLEANISYRSTEKKEEFKRLSQFYFKHFVVKIIKNPPKVVEFGLFNSKNGIYGDLDEMLDGYRAFSLTKLRIGDLLDFDIFEEFQKEQGSPLGFFKWFVKSLVHAVFYCFFIDFIYLMTRIKPLEYFANKGNQGAYNNQPGQVCGSFFRTFSQVSDFAMKKKSSLRTHFFKTNLKRYYQKFLPYCTLASKTGFFLSTFYEKYNRSDAFFIDGFCSRSLLPRLFNQK